LSRGFSHFFSKVRGRERPHRDLNPVPHWLAEVNLSLPLTIIIIADFRKIARWNIAQKCPWKIAQIVYYIKLASFARTGARKGCANKKRV